MPGYASDRGGFVSAVQRSRHGASSHRHIRDAEGDGVRVCSGAMRSAVFVMMAVFIIVSCSPHTNTASSNPAKNTSMSTPQTVSPLRVSASAGGDACRALVVVPCAQQVATVDIPVAGTRFHLHYESDRVPGRKVAPMADVRGLGFGGWTLDVHEVYVPGSGVLLLGDGSRRTVRPVRYGGKWLIASRDGRRVYEFDARGRHLRTLDAVTGAVLLRFEYDRHGLLSAIDDRDMGKVTVQRASDGSPEALIAGRGVETRLAVGPDGMLASVQGASGRENWFKYGKGGLLTTWTRTAGPPLHYAYDAQGRLEKITGASGAAAVTIRRTQNGNSVRVSVKRSGQHAFTVNKAHANGATTWRLTYPDGGRVSEVVERSGEHDLTLIDGTTVRVGEKPDPRFGAQAPVPASIEVRRPGKRTVHYTVRRTASFTDPRRPEQWRLQVTGPAGTASLHWTADKRELVRTSPAGRTSMAVLDGKGRVKQFRGAAGRETRIERDAYGIPAKIVESARKQSQTIDFSHPSNEPVLQIERAGRKTRIAFDPNGRPVSATGPGGRVFSVRRTGPVTEFTLDGSMVAQVSKTSGQLTYTVPGVGGRFDSYRIEASGGGLPIRAGWAMTDAASLSITGDKAGRIAQVRDGTLTSTFGYDGHSPIPTRISSSDGVAFAFGAVGRGLGGTWSGLLAHPVGVEVSYDDRGRAVNVTAGASPAQVIAYDADGLLTRFGPLALTRDVASGAVMKRVVGKAVTVYRRDAFGRLETATTRLGNRLIASLHVVRDKAGRIIERNGSGARIPAVDWTYGYDVSGRLVSAKRNGVQTRFGWDARNNLTRVDNGRGHQRAIRVNALNQPLRDGRIAYAWGVNHALEKKTGPKGITTYATTASGELRAVHLPDGTRVQYVLDGLGRRVGRKVDGRLDQAFVYLDGLHPIAELAPDGSVEERFTWAADGSLAAIEKGGRTYAVVTDQTGSPLLVINANTGKVVQRIEYGPMGRVLSDSNPGFQPFGFAGGIYDRDTGLVHLGARDYDPHLARFISADPALGFGSPVNLYAYAHGDPVNRVDRNGLDDQGDSTLKDVFSWSGLIWNSATTAGKYSAELSGAAEASTHLGFAGGLIGTPLGLGLGGVDITHAINDISENGLTNANGGQLAQGVGSVLGGLASLPEQLAAGGSLVATGESLVADGALAGTALASEGSAPWLVTLALGGGVAPVAMAAGAVLGFAGILISENNPLLWGAALVGFGLAVGFGVSWLGVAVAALGYVGVLVYGTLAGASGGDPHMVSGDGALYSYQGVGEFWAARENGGTFEVQVRQAPAWTSRSVSLMTAVAARLGKDKVAVYAKRDVPLTIDGRPAALPIGVTKMLPGGGIVRRMVGGDYLLQTPGATASIRVTVGNRSWLGISIRAKPALLHRLRGLYGRPDGNPADDWTEPDGTVVKFGNADRDAAAWTRLNRVFGPSWRVPLDKSLFDGQPRTVADPSFPEKPVRVDTLPATRRDAAERVCRAAGIHVGHAFDNCVVDVATTGQSAFAAAAAALQSAHQAVVRQAGAAMPPVAASPTETYGVGLNETVQGAISRAGQKKVYTFDGHKGEVIYAAGDHASCKRGKIQYWLREPGSSGAVWVDACDDAGRRTLERAGKWQIVVRGYQGRGTGTYRIRLHGVVDHKKNIAVGRVLNGSIAAVGARDVYTFAGHKGDVVYLEGDDDASCKRDTIEYWLRPPGDAAAVWADGCDDIGRRTLGSSGTWQVVVRGAGNRGTGVYRIRLRRVTDHTQAVAVGQALSGSVTGIGVHDVYTFKGRKDEVIYIEGDHSRPCKRGKIQYWLRAPGDTAAVWWDGCDDMGKRTLGSDGTWALIVRGAGNRGTGSYRMGIHSGPRP